MIADPAPRQFVEMLSSTSLVAWLQARPSSRAFRASRGSWGVVSILQHAMWSVQCAVCSVQCAVCSVQCAVCSLLFEVCTKLSFVYCSLNTQHIALFNVQCAVLSVGCGLFSVQYNIQYLAMRKVKVLESQGSGKKLFEGGRDVTLGLPEIWGIQQMSRWIKQAIGGRLN